MMAGPRLRVLSYNVHSLSGDLDALAEVVRGVRPDVAILQEAPRRFRWRQRCADLARSFDLFVAAGGLPSLGNLLLTNMRVRVRDTWCVQYPLTPGKHMRGAAFARCTVGRVPFVVAGSHLSTDATERVQQATILKKYLSEVDDPLIFGADLNENSGGAAWRTVADGLTDAAVASSAAPASSAASASSAAASASSREDRPTYPCAAPRDRIDAVLVDPRCTVEAYELVAGELARAASDHFPLVVDLTLPA